MMGFGRSLRNLGSRASAPAKARAAAVSTGNNSPRRLVKHSGRGSSAGLNAQKTARLEVNGTGYTNPALRRGNGVPKRYPSSDWTHKNVEPTFIKTRTPKMSDYRKPKTLLDR